MYRICRGDRKESEYTHTAAGVDPYVLDRPSESERLHVGTLAFPSESQDWSRYYEQPDPGTSTDILDTDEAKQTASLILQQASAMAAEGGDEMPLIFTTQTTATIADLDIGELNFEEPNVSNIDSNIITGSMDSRTLSSLEEWKWQVVFLLPSLEQIYSLLLLVHLDPGCMLTTVPSVVLGSSSVGSVVPYDRSSRITPPYNSSAMYEDSTLPVYVNYIGNLMPILDIQSIATNWPPTPHPLTGQIRYVPFNRATMPTVPYIIGVSSSLLPQPIQGQPALSVVASETQPKFSSDSVSQIGVASAPIPATTAGASIESFDKRQTPMNVTTYHGLETSRSEVICGQAKEKVVLGEENNSSVDMESTVPYVDHTQREFPFVDFMIPLNPPVRVSTVYAGRTALLSKRGHQMCLVKLINLEEMYGTKIFTVDNVTGEMYTVIEGVANKTDFQAYIDHGMEGPLESGGFAPTDTLTPKSVEVPTKSKSQDSKPFDLSVIEEQPESVSGLTCGDFKENQKKFKETPSISSVGEISQEITKEKIDRAYKKKNACSQRLTLIYRNLEIEKEMA